MGAYAPARNDLNLPGLYWGTTNETSIRSKIRDLYNTPDVTTAFVLFTPIAVTPFSHDLFPVADETMPRLEPPLYMWGMPLDAESTIFSQAIPQWSTSDP